MPDKRRHKSVKVKAVRAAVLLAVVFVSTVLLPAIALAAQESPYGSPNSGGSGGGFLEPFQSFPVWAQAALFTMGVTLIFFALTEATRVVWKRVQRARHGS